MHITGKPLAKLGLDAYELINLYASLGENAENFLPASIIDKLRHFVRLCHEQSTDFAKQKAEIDRYILELKEAIPGFVDVSLMLYPHEDSKAFQYQAKQRKFVDKLTSLINTEAVDEDTKKQTLNILNAHDYSVGTPPVTQKQLDYTYKLLLGEKVSELKKFRDVIGVNGSEEEAQWNYFLNVLDQMVIQASHYTTLAERKDFLSKTELTVNYKGLGGFIRTVVGGSADTAIKLISEEVFSKHNVEIIDFTTADELFEQIRHDYTKVFLVRVKSMRRNLFNQARWFPYLTRLVIIDDSVESQSTNTSLVFSFHNGIINILNKVHTKKLGALANSQLNLRLILDKINLESLEKFRKLALERIGDYEKELVELKKEQIEKANDTDRDIVLFKFDDFAKQILKDKYALTKLADYINLVITTKKPAKLKEQNIDLIHEFEERTRQYFYSNNTDIHIATINEGGGRNQIKTYGEWLLQKKLKEVDKNILTQCRTILDVLPTNYNRTLKNHFHKNFGINLFLEKYKEYLTKSENTSDNKGRFNNFLIDLGIKDDYDRKSDDEQAIIKSFISDLANLDKTSISDDVQMIIRDILFHTEKSLRPYILYDKDLSWEYQDLFPPDRFDLNPFDLEIGNDDKGRIDFKRLLVKLQRMKGTFQLFDDTGSLWDRFCENLTIVINDPSNPSGYTDFNEESLLEFLKFAGTSKITVFLDEAYNDAVKTDDPEEPKWRSISRYVVNNLSSYMNISIVTSLSTTKNLGGTGIRLGSLIASQAKKELIDYARKQNPPERCNTNSVYMLVNIIEAAQLAKKLKDNAETRLAKNASVYSLRKRIEANIKNELSQYEQNKKAKKTVGKKITRFTPFEGSPQHIFLLEELLALDKLEVLKLPDDFKYKGKPFFKYYQKQLVKSLNNFRINKLFRDESNKRLQLAKDIAGELIEEKNWGEYAKVVDSDGSYLFNLQLTKFSSFQGLEKFTKKLAEQRGIAIIPYQIGFIRFSLGSYLFGDEKSYRDFKNDFRNALEIFFNYWINYYNKRIAPEYKDKTTEDILDEVFAVQSDKDFVDKILNDFHLIKNIEKVKLNSLKISKLDTLYLSFPEQSGVNINSISESKNSVFEFYENIGECSDLRFFIRSKAFTKIYENLLPQVYKKIPLISHLDFETVLARFGKAGILRFIENKLDFQPNYYTLDNVDELNIMKEILIELEAILFSDAKFKIMALNATGDVAADQQKLEGINMILKKYIRELMIHFNLPFENRGIEPSVSELMQTSAEQFEETTGIAISEFGLTTYLESFVRNIRLSDEFKEISISDESTALILRVLSDKILEKGNDVQDKLLNIYLLKRGNHFEKLIFNRLQTYDTQLKATDDKEMQLVVRQFISEVLDKDIDAILAEVNSHRQTKIAQGNIHSESRTMARMFIDIINKTRATEYYDKYTHTLIKFIETRFKEQNSGSNEMIQHGITLYKDFDMNNDLLETYNKGSLKWIKELMTKCGVISAEQPVQVHTRKVTDAKKREYAYHKVDLTAEEQELRALRLSESKVLKNPSENEYIKNLATKPKAEFFGRRMSKFIEHMDAQDYRCKIVDKGLFKELVIFQKSYLKYLSDNYQLLGTDVSTLEEIKNFVPDVIQFLGAPEKVISFPKIGYFDLDGPNGKIKTLITPLDQKADYFGNVKKPRLTLINEKVKEMGGIPIHGSLFAIEEEDGGIFVVHVDGDSGVGKSEMLAAMILKWLKKDLKHIRSIKLIAGDMFHIFPDKKGNIYGIGTEVGDFSRVTDFDPDYIKYYNSLFESSSDSNVADLNSRSTISGLCDINMPFKIDIILTASNYAREEAGITRFDNPENFIYYRDSHGERKEKATSGDNPHFQRTLLRYTDNSNIVTVLENHGNYIDDILDWELDKNTGVYYLCSSFKMMDKIDIEDIVGQIFVGQSFTEGELTYTVSNISFDIIKNRFEVLAKTSENEKQFYLTRQFFSTLFDALASTPSGQPFISEHLQLEGRKHLLNILRGNYGDGKGGKIVFGVLSTDLGKKGREISGPQKAAEELKKLIQVVRIENPDIHQNKQNVRELVHKTYRHIFNGHRMSPEIDRYNFRLWQLEQMRKANFVRIDDMKTKVDLSNLRGFNPVSEDVAFSPLLVTPNINIDLNSYSENWEQLMNLPNSKEFANEFYEDCKNLYVASGYSEDTIINNLMLQLLLISGYVLIEDINRGNITAKVNREVLAAAKSAVLRYYNETKTPDAPKTDGKKAKNKKK